MSKVIKSVYLFFLLLFLLIPLSVYGQYLVFTNQGESTISDQTEVRWWSSHNYLTFYLVTDLQILDSRGVSFTLLDDDVETGYFYWLTAIRKMNPDWGAVSALNDIQLLWRDETRALIRVESPAFLQRLPVDLAPQKIIFKHSPEVDLSGQNEGDHSDAATLNIMQAILDSVNIDQIYITEEHLSGEEPYFINASLDSMQSRNSNHPHIFKAQNYIRMRLEEMGYVVDLDPFSMGGNFL